MARVNTQKVAAQIARYLKTELKTEQAKIQVGLPDQGMPAQQIGCTPSGPAPTVIGVSVPLVITMADGRELSVQILFAPEAAQNLQQLASWCAQAYGQYLAAKKPWRPQYSSGDRERDRDRYSDRGRRY